MSVDSISPVVILDIEGTLARFGGDKELFTELTSMLLDDAPQLFAELRSAAHAGNEAAAERRAHALKGLLLNCGGVRAAQAAQHVEDSAHACRLSKDPNHLEALGSELDLLIEAIRAYRNP